MVVIEYKDGRPYAVHGPFESPSGARIWARATFGTLEEGDDGDFHVPTGRLKCRLLALTEPVWPAPPEEQFEVTTVAAALTIEG